jgi:ABC-2 type transport system ATP-binding protein
MIEARALTKKHGDKTAVDDLSFTVRPGAVTGFLGPESARRSSPRSSSGAGTPEPTGQPYAPRAPRLSGTPHPEGNPVHIASGTNRAGTIAWPCP